ncbi:TadE/TadG family type IV pilus assembly protein [Massilia suwonensis]|uniref:TadE/TadG family type IV pilus assembly protein n=1 Tax=Massilia suwonensis TaxID=648895 RepID=A0ABW0MKY7_9BURK
MQAINSNGAASRILQKQRGGAAVEFALVVIILLTLIIGIMELARAMYICNTLQEVTRRAAALAANTDFSDAAAMQRVRERAIFRTAPGFLTFAAPVTDAHINIDYLAVTPDGASLTASPIPKGSLPANPARNQEVCTGNPNDAACIRLVRVRICMPGGGCDPVLYQSIASLVRIPFPLPQSTTIVTAETLGRPAGVAPAPCGC